MQLSDSAVLVGYEAYFPAFVLACRIRPDEREMEFMREVWHDDLFEEPEWEPMKPQQLAERERRLKSAAYAVEARTVAAAERMKRLDRFCQWCGSEAKNRCQGCGWTMYCCSQCQLAAWPSHKIFCDK